MQAWDLSGRAQEVIQALPVLTKESLRIVISQDPGLGETPFIASWWLVGIFHGKLWTMDGQCGILYQWFLRGKYQWFPRD